MCCISIIVPFPSPCGVWVVSTLADFCDHVACFRPLAGCGLFQTKRRTKTMITCFRPLAGCGLFLLPLRSDGARDVSVPLRGVGCFVATGMIGEARAVSVPLRGVGCFLLDLDNALAVRVSVPLRGVGCFLATMTDAKRVIAVSVPLRGVGCFAFLRKKSRRQRFPSPCGVWVVSPYSAEIAPTGGFPSPCGVWVVSITLWSCAGCTLVSVPLRGVGCFGKAAHSFWCNRKKNCQLCYFIVSYWQMFINNKLRNCKVPCEAHKTAT